MIVSAALEGLIGIVEFLIRLLPHQVVTMPGGVDAATAASDTLNWLGVLSGFMPLEFVIEILAVFVALIPMMFMLLTVEFVYDHLPTVAGTGT